MFAKDFEREACYVSANYYQLISAPHHLPLRSES